MYVSARNVYNAPPPPQGGPRDVRSARCAAQSLLRRQSERKRAPLAQRAAHPEIATHAAGQVSANGKAQPRSAGRVRQVSELHERLEDFVLLGA